MRISDWSSDVCSSDLVGKAERGSVDGDLVGGDRRRRLEAARAGERDKLLGIVVDVEDIGVAAVNAVAHHPDAADEHRSEEHTSELQSLMRISYAVFCLQKKRNITRANQ